MGMGGRVCVCGVGADVLVCARGRACMCASCGVCKIHVCSDVDVFTFRIQIYKSAVIIFQSVSQLFASSQ